MKKIKNLDLETRVARTKYLYSYNNNAHEDIVIYNGIINHINKNYETPDL